MQQLEQFEYPSHTLSGIESASNLQSTLKTNFPHLLGFSVICQTALHAPAPKLGAEMSPSVCRSPV